MDELVIPPAVTWFKVNGTVCAPDNTFIYFNLNSIVIVRKTDGDGPPKISLINGAHSHGILSVGINKKWGDPHSYIVSASEGEEGVIKIWNADTLQKAFKTTCRLDRGDSLVGALFAGDDRIVSVSSMGLVFVWNIHTNQTTQMDIFKFKVTIVCLSPCPHVGWLVAFGSASGLILIADVRRTGKLLYKVRAHERGVTGLSWCPAPVNIFPKSPRNTVKNKSAESETSDSEQTKSKAEDQISGDETHMEVTPQDVTSETEKNGLNPFLMSKDEATEMSTEPEILPDDFLLECARLKSKILGLEEEPVKAVQSELDSGIGSARSREIVEEEEPHAIQENRPFPKIFDPSGDFLDDSCPNNDSFADLVYDKTKEADSEAELEEKDDDTKETPKPKVDIPKEPKEQDVDTEDKPEPELAPEIVVAKPKEPEEEEPRMEYLLASSGRDRNVYIWRGGTDGRMQIFFSLGGKKSRDSQSHHRSHVWSPLHWMSPTKLVTVNKPPNSELAVWTLPRNPKNSPSWHKLPGFRGTSVMNISSRPVCWTMHNWKDEAEDESVWVTGQMGQLIYFDLKKNRIRYFCSAISTYVSSLASSPLDPNQIAIGQGAGTIHIWNLSKYNPTDLFMVRHHAKISGKVTTLAWHPENEVLLAFGTDEGRVGVLDTGSDQTTLLLQRFHGTVHKVEWGPKKGDHTKLCLYALFDGKLVFYDHKKPNDEPISVELTEKHIYKFAWKPDLSLLVINCKDGSMIALTRDLKPITNLYLSEKGVTCIAWHPDRNSSRSTWFAASTNKCTVVYNCDISPSNQNGGGGGGDGAGENDNLMDKIVARFGMGACDLAWSSHEGNKLVTANSEGVACVYDVDTSSVISVFTDFSNYLMNVLWSPLDPDLVISADRVLTVWRVSKNPPLTELEIKEKKSLARFTSEVKTTRPEKRKIKIEVPGSSGITQGAQGSIVPTIYSSSEENFALQVENMRRLMNAANEGETDDEIRGGLQLLGRKEDVLELLEASYGSHQKEGKHNSCLLLDLWKGNVADSVKAAIAENRVTPTILSLAPMVSPKIWLEACSVYAQKLSETAKSDPMETATYFLACHRVEDAINSLCANLMFREAVALAKARLPANSIIVLNVVKKWAQHCVETGNFELAAHCLISIEELEDAAKILSRRNNVEFLEFAAELAEKINNKELYDSIKYKCNQLVSVKKNGSRSSDSHQEGNDEANGDSNDDTPLKLKSITEVVLEQMLVKLEQVSVAQEDDKE